MTRLILSLAIFASILPAQGVVVRRRVVAAAVTAGAFDVAGAGANNYQQTSISANHTITNTRLNAAVVAVVNWVHVGTSPTVSGCTYNSQVMTQMWNFNETGTGYYGSAGFVISATAAGLSGGTGDGVAHSVSCTFTAAPNAGASLQTLSFHHVNQSTPLRASSAVTASITTTGTGLAQTTVSNAQSGDVTVDGETINTPTYGTTSQTIGGYHNNVLGNGFSGAASYALATGSTVMGYSAIATGKTVALGAAALAHE